MAGSISADRNAHAQLDAAAHDAGQGGSETVRKRLKNVQNIQNFKIQFIEVNAKYTFCRPARSKKQPNKRINAKVKTLVHRVQGVEARHQFVPNKSLSMSKQGRISASVEDAMLLAEFMGILKESALLA